MSPREIIDKYYPENTDLHKVLLSHGLSVAEKALSIVKIHPEMNLDKDFVYEAAVLHDLGIFKTYAPDIYCFGEYPYICHGYLGSNILNAENMPRHALVCERHTGVGLSLKYIKDKIEKKFPHFPQRDMRPVSLEEQLICFADKFFSKTHLDREKSIDKIRKNLAKYGKSAVNKFDKWCKMFLS